MQSKKPNSPGFSNSFRKCTKYLSAFSAELNSRKLQKVTLLSYTAQWETLRLFKLTCKTWALKQLSKYYGRSLGWQFPQCSCLPLVSDKGFTLPVLVAAIGMGQRLCRQQILLHSPSTVPQQESKRGVSGFSFTDIWKYLESVRCETSQASRLSLQKSTENKP